MTMLRDVWEKVSRNDELQATARRDVQRSIDVDVDGATIHVEFWPYRMSDDLLDDLDVSSAIVTAVAHWNVEGPIPWQDTPGLTMGSLAAQDQIVPIEPSIIDHLPASLLAKIVEAMVTERVRLSRTCGFIQDPYFA